MKKVWIVIDMEASQDLDVMRIVRKVFAEREDAVNYVREYMEERRGKNFHKEHDFKDTEEFYGNWQYMYTEPFDVQ